MSKKKIQIAANNTYNEVLLYTAPNGKVKVEIFLHDENIWLTQDRIALLFGVQRPAITKHLKNIFESKELIEKSVSSILEHAAEDGKRYQTKFYNLDAIISVGYRVNSTQATHFRIWATERLKEYIIKGFTMDDDRLKNPYNIFGQDYFEEQLARIREQETVVSSLDSLSVETQRLESIYQQKLTALEALKKSLLHQAFTGQL